MRSVKKFDARPKVNGSWKFIDDYESDDMLHGYLCYSHCDHGIIKNIHFPKEYDISEFIIVFAKDIPGENIVPEPVSDQLFLAINEVFHYGQPIMGIAHPDKAVLHDFIKEIEIEYKELDSITDIKQCLDDEKNHFGETITIDHRKNEDPDPEWIKHHNIYYTPHQEQAYLEPQGVIADYNEDDNVMFVRITAQCPYYVKSGVEAIMGDSIKDVIIETSQGIGGAFGGKEDFPSLLAGICSLLSYKSGKPVKIILDREDDIQITTKRHPSRVEIDTYTDPSSKKIMKVEIDYRLDAGAYQTLSPVVLARGVLHTAGSYGIPDAYVKGRLMRSNTPPNGAFRGFGAPQGFAAIEAHIDRIAADLSVSSYEFRKANIFKIGDEFPTTQKITEEHLEDCFDKVIAISDYHRKMKEFSEWNKTHKDKKGIGISLGFHGGGFTGNGEKILNSEVKIVIEKDAEVKIFVANTDMGQGAHTTLAQMFAEAIDHPIDKTNIQLPNTSKTPNSGPTVASRTIYIVGNLLKKMALELKDKYKFDDLQTFVKRNQNKFPHEIRRNYVQPTSVVFDEKKYVGIAYSDYSWAACVNEIYFHADTYKIELTKSWNVLDIGRVINEKIATGQAEGGILQGLAYGVCEFFYKPGFGRMNGFTDYTLPTSLDLPEIYVEFIHSEDETPKGLGEIPMDFPAPSIRNAFYQATGVFIDEYPLVPERIYKALSSTKGGK